MMAAKQAKMDKMKKMQSEAISHSESLNSMSSPI